MRTRKSKKGRSTSQDARQTAAHGGAGRIVKAAVRSHGCPRPWWRSLAPDCLGAKRAKERPSFFVPTATEKVRLEAVSEKLGKPGFNCKIRWAYMARHEIYNKGGRNTLWKGYIAQYTHPELQ